MKRSSDRWTRKDAYAWGQKCLEDAGVMEADLDAWYLLEYVTGITKATYYMEPDKELTEFEQAKYEQVIKKRSQHIPLQHITGEQEFMGLSFLVNEHVLIPRQDTETLVELGLEKLEPGMRVLDMCTGSGCIVISLEKLGKGRGFVGVDISKKALRIAKENCERLDADVTFIQSDLFAQVDGKFHMILSNPPYIRSDVIEQLQDEVKLHDPYIALDGKEDGLYFYKHIIEESREHLEQGGWLLFEIGYDQKEAVMALMEEAGFNHITCKKDLAGLDRVVSGMYYL